MQPPPREAHQQQRRINAGAADSRTHHIIAGIASYLDPSGSTPTPYNTSADEAEAQVGRMPFPFRLRAQVAPLPEQATLLSFASRPLFDGAPVWGPPCWVAHVGTTLSARGTVATAASHRLGR